MNDLVEVPIYDKEEMNAIERDIEKAKLIESIIGIEDVDIIKKVRSFLKKSSSPSDRPAVMTVEELKEEVTEATADVLKEGGLRHADFVKEMKSWM